MPALSVRAPGEALASEVDISVSDAGLSPRVFPWRCRRWWQNSQTRLAFASTGFDLCVPVPGCDTSIGWNVGSPSPFTVRLIDDLILTPPGVGTPVPFEIGGFRFRGFFQRWAETRAIEGNPPYDVFVTDPREILDGAQSVIAADLERQTPLFLSHPTSTWSGPNSAQCSLLVPAADSD